MERTMKEIKKILCAVDLSEHSAAVAEYATMLAKGLGASVIVVYTAPSLSQYVGFHVPPNTIENFVGEIIVGHVPEPCCPARHFPRRHTGV